MAFRREHAGSTARAHTDATIVLARERLASLPRLRRHGVRNFTKAVADLVEIDGRAIILKDIASRPWPVRLLLGPWQLDRKGRAYRALAGVRGTPAFVARIDRQAIALEYVPGRSLASYRRGGLEADFFDRLDRLPGESPAPGVAHGAPPPHDGLAGPGRGPA